MGLFDAFQFDPNSYDGGGLLAGLRQRLQADNQPSPLDQAQWPAGPKGYYGQDRNVPYGGLQVPQFGSPQQNPMDANAQLPPTAQPAQYQAAPQAAAQPSTSQPTFLQPNSPSGFGGAMRGAMANMQGGPLGLIGGAIAGGLGMGEGTERQQSQQNLKAQYDALVPMLGAQKAMLAVLNPEAGKTLLSEALTNKETFQQTGEDGLGRKTYGFVNPRDQTVNGKPISQQPQDTGGGLGNMDLTGADYLASLPKPQANTVQMMVEGKIPPPSSFALSKPYWQNMIAAAKNYDPTFDATNWAGRVAGVKDFSAGKSSEMVRSANQTLHHVGALIDSMDNLGNKDYPLWNRAGNAIQEATGSGAQGAFRTNAHAVAEELAKVFKGANLSDAEIHAWEQNLHENMSPEQQRTQVKKLNELLTGSLHALEEKRTNSMGTIAAEKAGPLLKEEAQQVLARMNKWIANTGDKPANSSSANPNIDALLQKYGH